MSNLKYFFVFCILICVLSSEAVKVKFPDEELSSESVLPIFKPRRMVLDRKVSLKYRFEIGATASLGLDEPFYYSFYGTGLLAFYLTEAHGIGLTGTYFAPTYSEAGRALKEGRGLDEGKTFDVHKVPYPQLMGFLNYHYTPFYGKISLTKRFVLNLSIYSYIGPGLVVFNDNSRSPAGNIGIGQKLYFNKWFGIRADLGLYGYHGPEVSRIDLGSSVPVLKSNQLNPQDKGLIFNLIANLGVVLLI